MKPLYASIDKPKKLGAGKPIIHLSPEKQELHRIEGNTMAEIGHWKDEKRCKMLALNKTCCLRKNTPVMEIPNSPFRRRL